MDGLIGGMLSQSFNVPQTFVEIVLEFGWPMRLRIFLDTVYTNLCTYLFPFDMGEYIEYKTAQLGDSFGLAFRN